MIICPNGTFENNEDTICEPCKISNCFFCLDSTENCLSCKSPYFLYYNESGSV